MSDLLASTLASVYQNGNHTEPSAAERDAFMAWLEDQFNTITSPVFFTDREVSPDLLMHTYLQRRVLLISSANNDSVWPPLHNLMFRAVHDWHHISGGCDFTLDGEIQAYVMASKTAPESIHWILFSEIILQAATAIHTNKFPDQKLCRVCSSDALVHHLGALP
jgi:hypothetical protein